MQKLIGLFLALILLSTGAVFAKSHNPHKMDMPDPKAFNAHFGDMDTNGDGEVDWEEFQAHFPQAEKKVFDAVDLDGGGTLNHEEWHAFKEAHGLKQHD